MTQKEFIVPLAFDTRNFTLFNKNLPAIQRTSIREGIPSLEQSVSIRPRIAIEEYKYADMQTFAIETAW